MADILVICSFISASIAVCFEHFWLAACFWIVGLVWSSIQGMTKVYMECIVFEYPKGDYVCPRYLRSVFKRNGMGDGSYIPKEIVISIYMLISEFAAHVFWMVIVKFFIGGSIYYLAHGFLLLFLVFTVVLLLIIFRIEYKIFIQKFKRLTRHNWWHIILNYYRPRKSPEKIGKCEILSEKKIKKKIFVTVKVIDTEETFSEVIFSAKRRNGKKQIYNLYEICKVKYIE